MRAEQIRQSLRELDEEAARKKAAVQAAIKRDSLRDEMAELRRREIVEERASFVAQQTEKVLTESGVLDGFEAKNQELEGKYKYHIIVSDYREGKLTLAWSKYHLSVRSNCVYGEDFSYIVAEFNPYGLVIRGKDTYLGGGFNFVDGFDEKAVEEAIAKAFADPCKYPILEG